ncbi:MAG: hypothetical protein ACI8RD_008434 [Bacillariaceae sp.]|jgi:hypothetical protein
MRDDISCWCTPRSKFLMSSGRFIIKERINTSNKRKNFNEECAQDRQCVPVCNTGEKKNLF